MTPGRPSWMRLPGTIYSTAELKSALQKLLRRRDPRAYDVTRLLLDTPESTQALLRRLVIIAAEEGTLGVVPEAMELLAAYGRKETRATVTLDAVLQVIARLMATPRDKDPAYLENWPQVAGPDALAAERAAAALRQTWSTECGMEVLKTTWAAMPVGLAKDMVFAMRRRAGMGVLEGDLKMFCGIALALTERDRTSEVPVLPVEEEPVPPASPVETLPWWCFDPHIAVGKKALKQILAVSPYADWNRAFAIWFRLSSDQLAGYVEREGWRAKQFARDVTPEDQAWWESVEPIARRVIEGDMARRTAVPQETPLGITPADGHEQEVVVMAQPQQADRVDEQYVQSLHEKRDEHRAELLRLADEIKRANAEYKTKREAERTAKAQERAQKTQERESRKALNAAKKELRELTKMALKNGQAQAAVAALRAALGPGADVR